MKTCNEADRPVVSPAEVVSLYWETADPELMPLTIRDARAPEEELSDDFLEWYVEFQKIMREENERRLPQDREVYPPESEIIAELLKDYQVRKEKVRAAKRAGNEQWIAFESVARSQLGRHVAYREGANILFMAELLNVTTDKEGPNVTLRIVLTPGLDFFPRFPVVEIASQGEFTVGSSWDFFYFDQTIWHAPYLGWAIYFDEAALDHLVQKAAVLVNMPPSERIAILRGNLMEDSNRAREAKQ